MASCSPARPGHGGQGRGRAGTDLGPRDPCTEQYNDRDVIFILSAASLAAAGLGHGSLVLSFSLRKLNRNGSEAGLVHEPHIEIPPVNLDNTQAPNPSPVQPTVVTTPPTSSLSSDFQVGFGEQPLMIITIIQVPESSMIDGMIIKLLALKTRSKLMKDPGKPEMSSTGMPPRPVKFKFAVETTLAAWSLAPGPSPGLGRSHTRMKAAGLPRWPRTCYRVIEAPNCVTYQALLDSVTRLHCTSDSLNISERARWVACLLGRTRGHGRGPPGYNPERPRNKQK